MIAYSEEADCYDKIPFEIFAEEVKKLGITSIGLCGPSEWLVLKKMGLTCALPWGEVLTRSLDKGFCDLANHDEPIKGFEDIISRFCEAGYDQIICFSGNRRGMSDLDGMRNRAAGLKKLMAIDEKHNVTKLMDCSTAK